MEILIAFIIIIPAALALFFFGIRGALGDKSNQLEKAKKLSQQGQYEEAINVYNNLILKEQFNPMYHMLLADAYYASNNYQRAVVEYEIALKDQQKLSLKDIFTVNKYLGLSYYRIQNFPKAFLSLYNAFYNDPQDATVCLFLGLVYTSQKKFAKAMDFFSKGENIDSMNFDLRYYSGMIAAHLGKRDIAIRSHHFREEDPTAFGCQRRFIHRRAFHREPRLYERNPPSEICCEDDSGYDQEDAGVSAFGRRIQGTGAD